MKQTPQREITKYSTQDFYLSCFLKAAGFEVADVVRQGSRSIFVFNESPALQQTIQEFYCDGPVRRFVHAIRDLKSRLYA